MIALGFVAASLSAQDSVDSLRVLTYNAWHGTFRTLRSSLLELPSESRAHRELRHRVQLEQLAELRPDVLLLQEVNPLPDRAVEMAAALDLQEIHKVTDCGIKFLGLGVPGNINSGLAILARQRLKLRLVAAERLSGRWAFCGDRLGLQLEEARYALLAQITLGGGDRYLLVNVHLHNAPEFPPDLRGKLAALGASGELSRQELETIRAAVERGQVRQRREIQRLIDLIRRRTTADPGLAGVILGGDLNAAPDSEHLDRLRRAGLVDATRATAASPALLTSDPRRNPLLATLVRVARPDLPTFDRPALTELGRRPRPRQIDYLLVSGSGLETAVKRAELFGLEEGAAPAGHDLQAPYPFPLIGSDHFGIALDLELRRTGEAR